MHQARVTMSRWTLPAARDPAQERGDEMYYAGYKCRYGCRQQKCMVLVPDLMNLTGCEFFQSASNDLSFGGLPFLLFPSVYYTKTYTVGILGFYLEASTNLYPLELRTLPPYPQKQKNSVSVSNSKKLATLSVFNRFEEPLVIDTANYQISLLSSSCNWHLLSSCHNWSFRIEIIKITRLFLNL
jgi:hypothetical protein